MTDIHYLQERIRQFLATDPALGILHVSVRIDGNRVILSGEVASAEKADHAREAVERIAPGYEIVSELAPPLLEEPALPRGPSIRIAASGDLHYDLLSSGKLRPSFETINREADLLLLAGDLTDTGQADEARLLAEDLGALSIPVVAILGNHDYHTNQPDEIRRVLEGAGVIVLEGESTIVRHKRLSVGIAGTKGFGGGFEGACGTAFGEPEMKAFMMHSEVLADRLRRALLALETDRRIALVHYSPIPDTLAGERPEIFPFLGSYLLAEAIDEGKADLAIHGHSHHGRDRGATPGGVPVLNVAIPILRKAFAVYTLSAAPVEPRKEAASAVM